MFILTLAAILFFIGNFLLTAISSAFRRLHKKGARRCLNAVGSRFFYRSVHRFLFPKQEHEYESLFFVTFCAQHLSRFAFLITAFSALFLAISNDLCATGEFTFSFTWLITLIGLLLFSFFVGDYLPRLWGMRYPESVLYTCAPIASLYLLLSLPIAYFPLAFLYSLGRTIYLDPVYEPKAQAKQEIIDIIQETDLSAGLGPHDKKLISSVLTFREHIVREVMVPRVNVFSLPASTTIKEAARLLEEEGYSRIPVYRNTVDNIVGILMYKDVLKKYMEYEQKNNDIQILLAPIETIQKPPLYTPETKRISNLLQEFRKKQMHLAIVVDEYGGTEGIVTIEDLLEQIVGEIADEYDDEDEELFIAQAGGGWIVDARMNLLDAEEQLGVKIPQDGDYDTIGGYIYHCTGTIPSKGFMIQHDDFEIRVLKSNDRFVEKVRIDPKNQTDRQLEHED